MRVVVEAERDELKERALWSYRANPPMEGEKENRRVVPFERWWSELTQQPVKVVMPDEEKIKRLMQLDREGKMRRVK